MSSSQAHVKDLIVLDLMIKDVITVSLGMTIKQVMELFVSKNISGAPIVDQAHQVVSLISEKDLLQFGAMNELGATVASKLNKLVSQDQLISVKKSDPFREVFKNFLLRPVKRVLVIDDTGHLQGIVTRSSLLKAFLDVQKKNDSVLPT